MNKRDFVRYVTNNLRENGKKKPIFMPKQVFHISDDEGNSKDFIIKKTDRRVIYTIEDVESVVNACIQVIEDALKRGEQITIHGFGTLGLKYRKGRETRLPTTPDPVIIEDGYFTKFVAGQNLRLCAKVYEMSLEDRNNKEPMEDIEENEDIDIEDSEDDV